MICFSMFDVMNLLLKNNPGKDRRLTFSRLVSVL